SFSHSYLLFLLARQRICSPHSMPVCFVRNRRSLLYDCPDARSIVNLFGRGDSANGGHGWSHTNPSKHPGYRILPKQVYSPLDSLTKDLPLVNFQLADKLGKDRLSSVCRKAQSTHFRWERGVGIKIGSSFENG